MLDQAVQILRNRALAATSGATVNHLLERLIEQSAPTIQASSGAEFEDDVWYAGTGKAEDDEIERHLEFPFEGGDVDDEMYTET